MNVAPFDECGATSTCSVHKSTISDGGKQNYGIAQCTSSLEQRRLLTAGKKLLQLFRNYNAQS